VLETSKLFQPIKNGDTGQEKRHVKKFFNRKS